MPAEPAKADVIRQVSRTRDLEEAMGRLADRQHGVVGRAQLEELGLGEAAIRHRRRLGRLRLLYPGAFAVGHRAISRQGRWLAAVLASGPEAVLSHWSAAALWMIRPNSRLRVDVTVPHRSRSSRAICRHVSQVPPDERAVVEGIQVTSVPRTTFDLAATEDVDAVVAMLREAEYRELWDRLSLWDLLERYPRKRGSRTVRSALRRLEEEPLGRKRSKLEERFAPFLRQRHLPLPRFNDWIVLSDGRRYQADCHWPDLGEIVELDGWQGHKTRAAFRNDRARDRILRVHGYSITHLTWNQIDDEPEAIAADLRTLLGVGAPS